MPLVGAKISTRENLRNYTILVRLLLLSIITSKGRMALVAGDYIHHHHNYINNNNNQQ
ncbi:hypothetical protein Ahy_B09g095531 isoform F [Arachis hypogaea]|nr:hypothetical protein Ahy_B09g095531 isoform F [Arachis hypogaea]